MEREEFCNHLAGYSGRLHAFIALKHYSQTFPFSQREVWLFVVVGGWRGEVGGGGLKEVSCILTSRQHRK